MSHTAAGHPTKNDVYQTREVIYVRQALSAIVRSAHGCSRSGIIVHYLLDFVLRSRDNQFKALHAAHCDTRVGRDNHLERILESE